MRINEQGSCMRSRLLIVGEPARLQSRGGVWNEWGDNEPCLLFIDARWVHRVEFDSIQRDVGDRMQEMILGHSLRAISKESQL